MSKRSIGGGVYRRGGLFWIWYTVDGARHFESAHTADRRAAQSLLAEREREVREGTWIAPRERKAAPAAPSAPVLTVGAYLDTWIARRRENAVRNVRTEAQMFADHVKPAIGELPLAALEMTHVRDLVARLQRATSEKTGRVLSARTVLHVYRTLALALKDATREKLIAASPCTLETRKGELPKKRDRDPRWRAQAVYTREELERLLTDERIPSDRQVLYGLQALAGLRAMEAAGRRWRDYDASAQPLGRLLVASQADGADGERSTKTEEVRETPVVPALAALLESWRREGFPLLFGRHPTPDDPIVPSRDDAKGRSFRSRSAMFDRLKEDRERIGLRAVPAAQHSLRASFLSLLELAGANLAIARRATHAAPSDVVGGYVRVQWADVCREVGKLAIELRADAPVVALPVPAAAAACDSPRDNRASEAPLGRVSGPIRMGVAGLERASVAGPQRIDGTRATRRTGGGPQSPRIPTRAPQVATQGRPTVTREALADRLASLDPDALERLLAAIERDGG
jgi:integrase